jgi:hypothetical protein
MTADGQQRNDLHRENEGNKGRNQKMQEMGERMTGVAGHG